jgi:hypothetical protein
MAGRSQGARTPSGEAMTLHSSESAPSQVTAEEQAEKAIALWRYEFPSHRISGLAVLKMRIADLLRATVREGATEQEALLCDVAQIFDGWHSDGTAWSAWDESVRRRVSDALSKLRGSTGSKGGEE